ncbi:MAG: TetR/AcrR family transcriptional regulator [Clostridiales bacterium]|nr:TetR/AcrR family transcriptional regulator [Clostridiales bacterium]
MAEDSIFSQYHKSTFDNIPVEKRNRILDVATKEFANKGFENANINNIARDAGVSVGSLYKYFNTKQDLFLMTVHMGVDSLEHVLINYIKSSDSITEKLENIIKEIQVTSRKFSELIKLYNQMTVEGNAELVKQISVDMETVSSKTYSALIRQGQKDGEIRKDIDPDLAAFMLDNLFMSLQFSYACDYYKERFKVYAGEDVFEKDDFVVKQMVEFIKSAFSK